MTKDTIAGFLIDHASSDSVSFHMPGHKGSLLYRENGYEDFLKRLIDCDITEIPGADNLFQTEGIIKATMERYRKLYGAKASYLLINGSSCGLISAIMTCVPRGGKIIIARNCHKSVFNGVSIAGAEPVYAYPEIIEGFGITGEITAKEIQRCLDEAPDASAVLLPSPNYYGVCSDIEKIAEAVHQCGKVLIVDQAHGAHLKFFDQYIGIPAQAAENQGADIVIDSTHKTLASFTQTAVANVCSDRIDKYAFEDALQKMESTSPSYLMMASLDINADILEKHELKTPMAVVLSECELLLDENHEIEEYKESIEVIQKQCKRTMSMIQQLLQLSYTMDKNAIVEKETIDLSELCKDILEELQSKAKGRDVTLAAKIQDGVTIEGDQTLIIRMIENLVTNAIKYNRPQGHIWFALNKNEKNTIISVKDDGIGISQKDQRNIFNRFYKVSKDRAFEDDSFGLGLSMVKWIAEAHGGKVSVDSTEGEGSEFIVTL